ncbi:NAD(P)H-dependent FMN reductase [Wenyingzhuangia heitensis]|uniref:NAD(P)H-dependent FMN reductase n=1 Tax=Wenyingzhuangia heitensis TaxID=1487859 RepID=A0ABX0UD97_9FLAO|nr:NADPH-dependent FMN reductase [Wenyingzhuangia heitensis]NIJ46314.1 NAD(P)H-dependent FMN reductase [Wenyingzhuangia heitensis]
MKTIVVFGASNSKVSINKQLANYVATKLEDVLIEEIDLNDFEMPVYGVDKEGVSGIPELAKSFNNVLSLADGFVISFAEHNGAYSSAFKNIFDWVSRINPKMWDDKPMILTATSPGARGGQSVLDIASARMPYHGAIVTGSFSLPSFGNNFMNGKITNKELDAELDTIVKEFQAKL